MSAFPVFATLYMAGFLCEMAEKWQHPVATWLFIVLATGIAFTRVTRLAFFVFLAASSAYVVVFHFPEVANHVNLLLFINLGLILGILRSWLGSRQTDEDYLREMLPFLRLSLVLVYSLAGLHKLNSDFFDPTVSCAGGLVAVNFIPMLQSTALGLPTWLVLAGSAGAVVFALLGDRLRALPSVHKWVSLPLLLLGAGICAGLLFAILGRVPDDLKHGVTLMMAVMTVAWELLGGLMLLVPRLQGPVLVYSFGMHAALALVGFMDFGSIAFALLFCFIPRGYLDLLLVEKPSVEIRGRLLSRIHVYLAMLLVANLLAAVHYQITPAFGNIKFVQGLILDAAALVFLWPVLERLVSRDRLPWKGVPVWSPDAPGVTVAIAIAIFLHGMTGYLGLRTAGNFSMFSNLRTEGESSNHLLFGGNPFKTWSYQEDVVLIREIDDRAARAGHKYVPLKGMQLPVVELRKLIHAWDRAAMVVPLELEYRGRIHRTDDIVREPAWATPRRSWEMILMDFRVIQPEGPNQCRW